ncbi:uncharacterized protein LOC141906225 [Tubulanus polymorphus]|uniref:uncharacterized protein LOC141906225 n=1 Tax=Tubulanus polymorphus TaxID=672921 RepID=UPI003DA527B3
MLDLHLKYPEWDEEKKLLKVGGRLRNSLLPEETKNPIILPPGEKLVEKLIMWYHVIYGHTGTVQTLADLRCRYWLIRGRQEAMRVINDCKCREPEKIEQKMGQLPVESVIGVPVFYHVGVDFTGPLYVKSSKVSVSKVYIVLYTCMAVRAIHLELVPDQTTEEFLRSFGRMMIRRGRCIVMFSDNAKTFEKASTLLANLFLPGN